MNQMIARRVVIARDMNTLMNRISGFVRFIALSHSWNVTRLG
jgi:hypothetical protein